MGIYARISSDRDGDRLGVERQLEDCLRLAERKGWQVAERFVDNDVSAWSGRQRPEYARLLVQLTEERGVAADEFSREGVVGELEERMAALLGKEMAIFLPSGTLANLLALRIGRSRPQVSNTIRLLKRASHAVRVP